MAGGCLSAGGWGVGPRGGVGRGGAGKWGAGGARGARGAGSNGREPAADVGAPQRALDHRHGGRRRRVVRRPGAPATPRAVPRAADRAGGREEPGARPGDRRAAAAVGRECVHRHAAARRPAARTRRSGGGACGASAPGGTADRAARGRAGGARAQRQASGRGRGAGPGIAVRPRAHRARPAGGRGTGPWRRGRAGAGAGGGPGAVSHHHQCARVGARGRAFGAGVSSRAAASRRRAGGDPGRRPGRARSCREGARLRGARRPLRAPGDRAAQGVRGIPRRGWGVSRDRELVAGLDLGSTKTCAVIAEVVGDLPRLPLAKVLGVGLAKNAGVRRGMVRDIDETSRSVVAALRDAERMAGAKVAGVTCGIAGEHVAARTSPGVVAVSREEITAEDVARVNEVARAISLGRDQELLHDIPQEYRVDQQHGISDPVGMTGTRLEVEMYLVTVQATAAQNLRKAVQRAGYRVLDLVLEPLAASYAVLTEDEKELGVALLEVGGGSSAGHGGAGPRGVRDAGARRNAGAGDFGAGGQRPGAALRGAGGAGAVRGTQSGTGRRARRLGGTEPGGRALVRAAQAVVTGLLLIGHPREP